eukprot:TRINITY_DN1325_c0_g1_i2.p1 TRINITY_DN1325_c0_g1~~TRINITY_DN1325_c0_g1_i2.p1  ORF type:complete len:251 (-),score=27.53 TRINITY_DN1325_c0_g1_i2:1069-1821(-)
MALVSAAVNTHSSSSICCSSLLQAQSVLLFSSNCKTPFERKNVRIRDVKARTSIKATSVVGDTKNKNLKRLYLNVTGFPFPLGPFLRRLTVRKEVVKGVIWTFEQEQALGFSSVTTNIRMTVIKLKSGGLWVHAPIAPTKECIQLLKELEAPVEHIILPTFAYEHKIFVGPFSRKFPQAKIWVAPRQWSWPLNLPLEFFGIFRARTLQDEDASTPWSAEIEQKVLSCPEVGLTGCRYWSLCGGSLLPQVI